MRILIISLSTVLMVSTLAMALSDDFSSYAQSDAWNPTEAVEGWTTMGEQNRPQGDQGDGTNPNGPNFFSITNDGVHRVNGRLSAENMESRWYANIPDADGDTVTTTIEWMPERVVFGSEHRQYFARSDAHGRRSWLLEAYGSAAWWPGPGGMFGVTDGNAAFNQQKNSGVPMEWMVANYRPGHTEDDDIGQNIASEWYVFQVEENHVANTARVRVGTKASGTFTAWGDTLATDPAIDYSDGGFIVVGTNGLTQIDNLSMVPEPVTLLVLGAGSLLLVRRRTR